LVTSCAPKRLTRTPQAQGRLLKAFGPVLPLTLIHPSAWKGGSQKFATPSNAQATPKITHLEDTPGLPPDHPTGSYSRVRFFREGVLRCLR
jgi:hypothetical protein